MKTLLILTLSGSAVALLLLALRYVLLRRMPSTVYYYAWLLVLLRLALPLPGLVGGVRAAEAPAAQTAAAPVSAPAAPEAGDALYYSPAAPLQDNPLPVTAEESEAAPELPAESRAATAPARSASVRPETFFLCAWALGTLVSLGYTLWAYLRFTRRLRRTLRAPEVSVRALYRSLPGRKCAIYTSRAVKTPLMFGLLSPTIVLPERDFDEAALAGIFRHELTHYRRGDALYKWFAVLVLSAHWFNPLSYLIRRELDRACELSCDELLLRDMSREQKQAYGDTLLRMAAAGALPAGVVATTFSTEKRNLKERLEQIMHYRRGAGRALAALLSLVLLAGCAAGAGPRAPEASSAPGEGSRTVHVSNVDELLAAIAPDTLILLDEGSYDFADAKDYGKGSGPYYDWNEVTMTGTAPCYQLVIHDADNLSIFGAGMDRTSICISPRYANVLHFYNCQGLTLSELTAGHSPEPGFCRGGVVELVDCGEVSVLYCGLYGCGTIGVKATDCHDLSVADCRIYECSYSAVDVLRCRNVRVSNCEIDRHGARPGQAGATALFSASNTDGFVLYGNRVHDNTAQYLMSCSYTQNAFFLTNEVSSNRFDSALFSFDQYPGVVDGCVFSSNTGYDGVRKPLWIINREADIVDRDGNSLTDEALEAMTLFEIDPNLVFPPVRAEKAAEAEAGATLSVRTVDELLRSLGPQRTILLDGALFDLSQAANYGSKGGEYYYWVQTYDGPKLVIHDVDGLTLRAAAEAPEDTAISAVPRYADVLSFSNCSDLRLEGFTAGHTVEPGSCSGGVLLFENCAGVTVERCRLYGCGILGLQGSNCRDVAVTDCEIYECSQGAVSFYRTEGLVFTGCDVHDVPSPALTLRECSGMRWNGADLLGERLDLDENGVPVEASALLAEIARQESLHRTWNGQEQSSPDSIAQLENPYHDQGLHRCEPGSDRAVFIDEVRQLIADGRWVELSKRIRFPVQVFVDDRAFHLWTPQEFVSSLSDESFCEKNGIEAWREQVAAASSEELGECLYGETFADHLMAFIAQDNGNGIISYRISCISLQTPLWPGNPPSAPAETTP